MDATQGAEIIGHMAYIYAGLPGNDDSDDRWHHLDCWRMSAQEVRPNVLTLTRKAVGDRTNCAVCHSRLVDTPPQN